MMTVSTVGKLVPRPQQRVSIRNTKCVLQAEKAGVTMESADAADDQLKLRVADADMPQNVAQIRSTPQTASCSLNRMPEEGVTVERAAPDAAGSSAQVKGAVLQELICAGVKLSGHAAHNCSLRTCPGH